MRVLYDTNVLVRILARRGGILSFREMLVRGRIKHVTSPHILGEVEAILVSKIGLTKQKAKVAARLTAKLSEVVKPTIFPEVCRDPDDNQVLAAAVTGNADYLVTLDKDLLVLGEYERVMIIKPELLFGE